MPLPPLPDHPWFATAVAALVAVGLALFAHALLRGVLTRVADREQLLLPQAVLRRTARAAAFAWPLLALQLVLQAAPDLLPGIGFLRHAGGVALIGAMTALAMGAIGGVADGVIARHPATVADNLQARRIHTQTRVLARSAMVLVLIGGCSLALMTFPGARQIGASLLASAGVLGLVAGLAARPVFSNLVAGLQIALAQPIRIDDVLIVQGEWGRVEEITGSYVVLRIWDDRRMVIPLQWFIENPFQNWTRHSAEILGTVFLHLDYATPVEAVRAEARRIVESRPEWDGRVLAVQVTDATERSMQLRVLVSAANAGQAFELRCIVREQLLAWLAREHPQCLPRLRWEPPGALPEPAR